MTANPWPSSDWIAVVSERGIIAAVALLGVFLALFIGAPRRWSDLASADNVLLKVTLAATLAAAAAASAFDAVLLLAAPALLTWSLLGAASGVGRRGREITLSRRSWAMGAVISMAVLGASVARSAAQMVAITTVGSGGTRAAWIAAAPWDPGSYRIQQRAAELHAARGRCRTARWHARRAQNLFPDAAAPRRVLRRCGGAAQRAIRTSSTAAHQTWMIIRCSS